MEVLTRVENPHCGVRIRMLFMDHLSADLLCKDLPGDRTGLQVINNYTGFNNTTKTSHMCGRRAEHVSPSCTVV